MDRLRTKGSTRAGLEPEPGCSLDPRAKGITVAGQGWWRLSTKWWAQNLLYTAKRANMVHRSQSGTWICRSHPEACIHRAHLALKQTLSLNPLRPVWCWGKLGTWAHKYSPKAARASLGPGSTGAGLVLSL